MGTLFWLLAIFLTSALLDQSSKQWALTHLGGYRFGPLKLQAISDSGVILNSLTNTPSVLRASLLSGFFFFLCFFSLIVLFMIRNKRVWPLKIGLMLLLGGILGNVLDRVECGAVIDWIQISFGQSGIFAFNLADAEQGAGALAILYSVFAQRQVLWFESNLRTRILVDRRYQFATAGLIAGATLMIGIALTFVAYSFLAHAARTSAALSPAFATNFLIVSLFMTVFYSAGMFLVGVQLTFYSAGPVYAFRKFVEDLLAGNSRDLKLRKYDHHRELEQIAQDLKSRIPPSSSL